MLHHFKYLFTILLASLLTISLLGCSLPAEDEFDIETQGIVEVILRDYNDGTIHFDCVGPNKTRRETAEFASETSEILFAASDCFETSVEENRVMNRLVHVALTDSDGNPAKSTPVIDRIFEKAAGIPHGILKMYILRQGEHHFVVAELNVNMFSPCKLFYFDQKRDQLTELYSYDATEVIGLRVRNIVQ